MNHCSYVYDTIFIYNVKTKLQIPYTNHNSSAAPFAKPHLRCFSLLCSYNQIPRQTNSVCRGMHYCNSFSIRFFYCSSFAAASAISFFTNSGMLPFLK